MNYKVFLFNLLKDIRFWIVFFFILHLSRITLPPLEPGSAWRQTDGLMVARNFYERDANILYPAVDVAGEKSGIVGCEFPILNYLIYLVSLIFGYESWYGRLINLIVSSIGLFFFFKLIRKYFGDNSAFNAAILVLVSVWFTYNRTNIPDTFAASLCIISLYYALEFLESGKIYHLLLFFVLGWVGCQSKISAACILTVLAIPFFLGKNPRQRKLYLFIASVGILVSVYWWYFIWVPYLTEQYGFSGHFFMGMPIKDGVHQLLEDWQLTLKRFYDTPFKYTGFLAFLIGLYLIVKNKLWLQLLIFLIPFTTFMFVILKSGWGFHINAYYVIMFIPPMAFVAGCGLAQLKKKAIVTFILIVVAIEGIANRIHSLEIREPNLSLVKLEAVMDKISQRDDLIAINGTAYADPTPMYFAHRRGWVLSNKDLSDPPYLNELKTLGCKYAVIVKQVYGDILLEYPKVYESDHFKIYRIQ